MAYYRPIYDPRDEGYASARQPNHLTPEQYARATQVRTSTIVPNYSRFALARGMYQELNAVYNDICPAPSDEDLYQRQHEGQIYTQQYNSSIDPSQNHQISVVPYGVQSSRQHRSYSPDMSGSTGDLRGMGIPSHVTPDADGVYSASPRDLTTVANRADMQWMVTTSNIDMRNVTPTNAAVSLAGHNSALHYNSSMSRNHGSNSSSAVISHQTSFDAMDAHHGGATTSLISIGSRPAVARSTKTGKPKGTPGRKRKVDDHELTPEEASKRHLRRERNKLAAAKCRNRRRELTDRLQGETDLLEDHQGMLTQEIVSLQQEKDHLEFILASHSPMCKVLQNKQMHMMGSQSPREMSRLGSCSENMVMHGDHGANLVPPMDGNTDFGHLTSSISVNHDIRHNTPDNHQQATTVSVIQAGPSLTGPSGRGMDGNVYKTQGNSVIIGGDSLSMLDHVTHSSMQAEDLSTTSHMAFGHHSRRFPASLPNLDVLNEASSCEPLNTPVCALATPSNTTAVFTFPNTPCITSSTLVSAGVNFSDAFSSATPDYNGSSSGSIMSTGNFLHPNQGSIIQPSYNSSHSVITSANIYGSLNARESCSAAHRRNSSSESHQSPDSVQSPKLLSL